MRLITLKVRKEYTVLIAVPSAVSIREVESAAERSVSEFGSHAARHPWSFTGEASSVDGLHQKPDLGLDKTAPIMKLRSWNPGAFDWCTISNDEEFEKMTGRPPPPEGVQIDLFGPKKP